MELKVGKINNIERKFIPIRKSKFEKYVQSLQLIEQYKITQYYKGNYKYRKFETDDIKYTRSKKEGDKTIVEEITEDIFLSNFEDSKVIVKNRKKYQYDLFTIEIDYFYKPHEFIMVEVSSDTEDLEKYQNPETLIEVTENPIFQNKNIANGSIQKSNIIIEGTDGVGKTTVIKNLLKEGIICQDRCEDVISKNMLFDISMEKRAKEIEEKYFSKNQETMIVFLINLDKQELQRRINSREKISEFDLEAYEYGLLYRDTYEYMIRNYHTDGRLMVVDCTGLSKEEQYEKVKKRIMG